MKKLTTKLAVAATALAAWALAASTAQADLVLYSYNFEPSGDNGGWATEVLSTGTDLDASLVPALGDFYGVLYAEQTKTVSVGVTITDGLDYTFSLDHFARAGQAPSFGGENIRMQIGYDNSGSFALLASQDFAETGTNPATLITRSISWQATGGSPALGETMQLRIVDYTANSPAHQAGIDNISLSAVPEPSTLALLGAGGLLLAAARMRKRLAS